MTSKTKTPDETVREESARSRLMARISSGEAATDATESILTEIPEDWRGWVRPFVLREARAAESRKNNLRLRDAFSAKARAAYRKESSPESASTDGKKVVGQDATPFGAWADGASGSRDSKVEQAKQKLAATVYRAADGADVLVENLTLGQIRHKIAQFRKQIGGIVDHVGILSAAETVILESGGNASTTLGEVPDWYDRVHQVLDTTVPPGKAVMSALPGGDEADSE